MTDAQLKELVVAFASAVTEATSKQGDLVAKNGQESLFGILEQVLPDVSLSFSEFRLSNVS